MEDKYLLKSLKDYVLLLTLNRPEASNAFHLPMIDELITALDWADQNDDIRVVVITGAGKHFCAGGDIKAMEEKREMFAGDSDELRRRYQHGIQKIPQMMEKIQKPVVAAVNGAAIGAGCDFAAMADIRLGCEHSKMGETFSKLALVPGDGGTYFLPRVVGYSKAMEMFLTGKVYSAQECQDMGLLNTIVPADELVDKALAWAGQIAHNSPVAIQMTKKALRISYLKDLQTSLDLLSAYQGITQRTSDHFEALSAMKEKRAPHFKGK
jgi:2-(1,2-epoxy-1,2-dihydrophenyl)acetyl-CoA isomerase